MTKNVFAGRIMVCFGYLGTDRRYIPIYELIARNGVMVVVGRLICRIQVQRRIFDGGTRVSVLAHHVNMENRRLAWYGVAFIATHK